MATKTRISVVVPTHYRSKMLAKTLKALLQQTYPRQSYEVLVVGSRKDKTLQDVEKGFLGKGIRFVRIGSTFADKKRNAGIKNAKYGIVAFTDDDCLPEKNWLASIRKAFEENKGIAGVEGLTWADNKALYCHAPENRTGNRFLSCNYAFKKSVLEKVKGFDERYHLNYREDTDLAFKVLQKGGGIKFVKEMRIFHPPIGQPLNVPLKDLKGVRSDVLLFKKFPKLYRERFGFICRGFFKLSAFSWLVLLFVLWSLYSGLVFSALAAVLSVFAVKILVEKKGRQGNALEWLAFVFFSYLRDILFPFAFAFQWAKVRA